ncbi:uncharacterized protein LOC144440854 isoform X2 [Glandiceps talaboti]
MMGCTPSKSVSDPHLSDRDRQAQTTVQEIEKNSGGKYQESDNLSTDDDTSQKLSQNDFNSDSNKDSKNNRFRSDSDTEKFNSINNRMKTQPPSSGVLVTSPQISQSQTEFFKMLDEKIERGAEATVKEDDVT